MSRSEGWAAEQIQRTPIFLDPGNKREFDIVTSPRSCGSGGCTWILFEISGDGQGQRLTWRGSFFGRGTVAESRSNGLNEIAVEARVGTDVVTSLLRFDGRRYR